jgi:hypothetical protein
MTGIPCASSPRSWPGLASRWCLRAPAGPADDSCDRCWPGPGGLAAESG